MAGAVMGNLLLYNTEKRRVRGCRDIKAAGSLSFQMSQPSLLQLEVFTRDLEIEESRWRVRVCACAGVCVCVCAFAM